jgi:hypothetical protein
MLSLLFLSVSSVANNTPINNSNIKINNCRKPFLVRESDLPRKQDNLTQSIESSDDVNVLGREAISIYVFAVRHLRCCRDWRNYPQLVLSARDEDWMTLVGLLATFWKVGIAASLYRVFTIYQSISNKKKESCFQQSTFFLCKTMARLWGGYLVPCFWVLHRYFQDEVSWGFFAIFLCRRTFLPEGLESRNWGSLPGCRRFRRRCGGSQMGLVTARNMAYCTGTLLFRATIIPLSAFYQTWGSHGKS